MKPFQPFVVVLSLSIAICFSSTAQSEGAGAIQKLSEFSPNTKWRDKVEVTADLNSDGKDDFAGLGSADGAVYVGIVVGPLEKSSQAQVLRFSVGKDTQDSLCSDDATLSLHEESGQVNYSHLPVEKWGCNRASLDQRCRKMVAFKLNVPEERMTASNSAKKTSLKLADTKCDAFWISWDSTAKKFIWNRN